MDISDMRRLVRRDLHDEEATDYRWTDAELDRHIQHAVRELSLSLPLQSTASLVTTEGSRDLSLQALAELIRVEGAEYPAGRYPPAYVRFGVWGATLTLHVDAAPAAASPFASTTTGCTRWTPPPRPSPHTWRTLSPWGRARTRRWSGPLSPRTG